MDQSTLLGGERRLRGRTLLGAGLLLGALGAPTLGGCAAQRIDDSVVPIVESADVAAGGRARSRPTLLVDVRAPERFAAGHLPGAVNIRLSDLSDSRFVEQLRSAPAVIVYGQNPGDASAMAMAKRLISMGVQRVSLFQAGYDAWQRRDIGAE